MLWNFVGVNVVHITIYLIAINATRYNEHCIIYNTSTKEEPHEVTCPISLAD